MQAYLIGFGNSMLHFKFDTEKSISVLLYVCQHLKNAGIEAGFHKLFKILYFADQQHLASYGRPIIGDYYVAMNYGPVPSNTYNILKSVKGDVMFIDPETYSRFFDVHEYTVDPKTDPDLELFADSEIDCLDKSLSENRRLGFQRLVDKSHDSAYKKASKDDKISFQEMAKVAGAKKEMLSYMKIQSENSNIFSK